MKIFNAFQITILFALGPFIIQWFQTASFYGHSAAFWVSVVAYIVGFIGITACVINTIDNG